jgi:hypothetical protein
MARWIMFRVSALAGKARSQWVPSICFLAGNEMKRPVGPLNDPDVVDQKTIVEANARIRFDQIFIGWTDSNFRDLHGTELSLAQKSPKAHKRNADVRRGGQDHRSFYEQRMPVSYCENQQQQQTSQSFLV